MKRLIAVIAAAAVFVIFGAAIKAPHPRKIASATVYIQMSEQAHGSGVDIGNGYILTAAHVADSKEDIGPRDLKIIDSLGRSHGVEVMWANHAYDVALLHITDDASDIASRALSCRYLDAGESLSFIGNPLGLRDVTTYGRLAKAKIEAYGPWAAINTVSGQLIPGMSGGPTLDRFGDVVGINVGIAVEMQHVSIGNEQGPLPLMGASPMGFDMSFIVPGRVICRLMDR